MCYVNTDYKAIYISLEEDNQDPSQDRKDSVNFGTFRRLVNTD